MLFDIGLQLLAPIDLTTKCVKMTLRVEGESNFQKCCAEYGGGLLEYALTTALIGITLGLAATYTLQTILAKSINDQKVIMETTNTPAYLLDPSP